MGATRQQIEELQANFDEQRSAKEKEISDQRVANEKALQRQKVDLALEAGQALSGLMEAFGGESEKNARRVFNVNKALGIAEVVINTARAIQAQLAVPQDALTGANFVKAGIAAAMGAAQVAKIASTQFQGGGGGGGGGGGRGGGAPSIPSTAGMVATGAPQLPQPEAPDQSQQSIRAFVVEKNVTDAQSQNQKINEQASLTI
jgi:Predicted membrane protein